MTTDAKSSLTFEELFGSTPTDPDSLFDRWQRGALDAASEEAVVDHLLGSSFSRDEAALRAVMWEGAARSAIDRRSVVERARIAVRRIADVLEVLSESLPALVVQAVPVRTGEAPALRGCSFEVDVLGAGRRLHVSPAAGGRFALSIDGAQARAEVDWVLRGAEGRMIMADAHDSSVVFTSVGAGTWTLERRDGDFVTSSVELSLQVDND